MHKRLGGFTLIEILVVIGIMAVLATITMISVNPSRQFKLARDSQRRANLNSIVNAMHENMSEHAGLLVCSGETRALPRSSAVLKRGAGYPTYPGDLAGCLVPDYVSSLPYDPSMSSSYYRSVTEYDTGYEIWQDTDGRIVASSTGELVPSITVIR